MEELFRRAGAGGAARAPGCIGRSDNSHWKTAPWSLRFTTPEVETAFLETRRASLFLALSRISTLLVCLMGPQIMITGFTTTTGDSTAFSHERFHLLELTAIRASCITAALNFFVAVLTRWPFFQKCAGFRGAEVMSILVCLQLFIYFIFIIAVIPELEGPGEEISPDFNYYRLAILALVADGIITVVHVAFPVRWFATIWLDCAIVLGFWTSAFTIKFIDMLTLLIVTGLVLGTSVGMRSSELKDRALYTTLVEERTMRAQAEFAATNLAIQGRPRPNPEANSVSGARSNVASAVSTTETGLLFNRLHGSARDGLTNNDVNSLMQLGTEERWLISEEEVTLTAKKLGHGGQGHVLEGRFCCGPVAVKRYTARSKGAVLNELRILRHVRHPNIALFHGAIITESDRGDEQAVATTFCSSSIELVMERVGGVNLDVFFHELCGGAGVTGSHAGARRSTMKGVSHALAYLHSRRPAIVHADLKPSNILVEQREAGAVAKLLDFGFSLLITRNATHLGGTKQYIAPEIMQDPGGRPSPAADVYSFGRVLFQVANGVVQTSGTSKKRESAFANRWQPCREVINEWTAVIESCTKMIPHERPKIGEAYGQAFGDGNGGSFGDMRDHFELGDPGCSGCCEPTADAVRHRSNEDEDSEQNDSKNDSRVANMPSAEMMDMMSEVTSGGLHAGTSGEEAPRGAAHARSLQRYNDLPVIRESNRTTPEISAVTISAPLAEKLSGQLSL